MASLESKIDELYQLAPSQFTEARNALAKTLGGEDAKRVKRLEKPTVVPWAVNQVYWRERPVFARLLKTGAALREGQVAALSGRASRGSVKSAGDAHRKALADAVRHAVRLASAAGLKPEPDGLARMLEALSLSPTPPPEPGRMTDLVQPAGFEALVGVAPAHVQSMPSTLKESSAHLPAGARDREAERLRARQAEAERRIQAKQRPEDEARERKAEADVRRAEQDLELARAAESRARHDLAQAEEGVRVAAEKLSAARSRLA